MAYLALAYEYFVCSDMETASETLQEAETKFKGLSENENIYGLSPSFSHVLKAMKVAFFLEKGDTDEASEVSVHFLNQCSAKLEYIL